MTELNLLLFGPQDPACGYCQEDDPEAIFKYAIMKEVFPNE